MVTTAFTLAFWSRKYVDDYVVFFDQIKYTTNSLAVIYDGYELKDVDFGDSADSDDEVQEVGDAK